MPTLLNPYLLIESSFRDESMPIHPKFNIKEIKFTCLLRKLVVLIFITTS